MASALFQLYVLVVVAATSGAAIGALLMTLIVRHRLRLIARAAKRLGRGELSVPVPHCVGALGPLSDGLQSVADRLQTVQAEATTDKLTGLANRPMLLSQLYSQVEHAVRYDRPLAILFADIDHFKDVNDTFGHDAGDEVLRQVTRIFRDSIRAADFVGRYGGEELVVILPETGPNEAYSLAEKLRKLVAEERFRAGKDILPITVSIGIAGGSGRIVSAESLLQHADAAMYSAKAMGRNCCIVFRESEDSLIRRAPIGSDERAAARELGDTGRTASEEALLGLVFPREHFTGGPSPLIASITVALARAVDVSQAETERIRIASLLHDIGKLAVADEILHKPGPLTPEEWRLVQQHPRIGELIVEEAGKVRDTGSIILHHHERYGGQGYPHGLRGIEIPIGARILAIADAYDAMILDRPYKRAIDHQAAVAELRRWSGVQFDPELVTIFCDLFASRPPRPDVRVVGNALGAASRHAS